VADLRLPAVVAALLLAACSSGGEGGAVAEADEDNLIACAIGGASQLTRNCAVERSVEDGVLVLVIHHEDGGFRRLRVMTDGSGVITADGADAAAIGVFEGEIEVTVASDRYILPATIAGPDPASETADGPA
jgi:hypothetical protein